jgi:phage tail-like protein
MPGGPGGTRVDPLPANSFWLEMGKDHEKVTTFQEVSGLESETEVRELLQSGQNGKAVIIKSQGAQTLKPGKITAKYAAFKGDPILKWRQKVVDGKMNDARVDCSIVVYSVEDEEILRFNLKNCWPSKYAWSSLSAKSNEPLQITVTIEHEGLEVAKGI